MKITDLPAIATPALADLLAIVDDPAGSPATKKVTLQQISDLLQAGDIPTLASQIAFLLDAPRCSVSRVSTFQSVAGSAVISFDVENFDTDGMFSSGTPTRVIPQTEGLYDVKWIAYASDAGDTTVRNGRLRRNGADVSFGDRRIAFNGATTRLHEALYVYCNGTTDYLELFVEESAAGNVNFTAGLTLVWVAPS